MTAVIERLGDFPHDSRAVAFTWSDVLRLEAACFAALKSRQAPNSAHFARGAAVLLLPRSALLLAAALACMRMQVGARSTNYLRAWSLQFAQMPWVIINPSARPDAIRGKMQLLPIPVSVCVTIKACESSSAAIAPPGGDLLLLLLLLDVAPDASHHQFLQPADAEAPPRRLAPNYFTFTSGSTGAPSCVRCSGAGLWARLATQTSRGAPLQGLVPDNLREMAGEFPDWTQFLRWCVRASGEGAAGGSVCLWKTAVEFCDTIVEMLQGVTFGSTQIIFCTDGALSLQCNLVALELCGRGKEVALHPRTLLSSGFDVRHLCYVLHFHQVTHMTAVPSLIASLISLEETFCPALSSIISDNSDSKLSQKSGCIFASLRVLASSGEALHCSLVERLNKLLLRHKSTRLSLINMYGCAETTADACCMEMHLPGDISCDSLGAVVPLGQPLMGSFIGVLMSGSAEPELEQSPPSSFASNPMSVNISDAEFVVSWLHDGESRTGSGRIVVGGSCVALGYTEGLDTVCLDQFPELSIEMLHAPKKSFFSCLKCTGTQGEVLRLFVTMDTAEIVIHDGKRHLCYRGRGNCTRKIKGVFVSADQVESVANRIDALDFTLKSNSYEWKCCARSSVSRACFTGDSLFCAVVFDFFIELITQDSQTFKVRHIFDSRVELNHFLRLKIQSALRQNVPPESIPALQNIAVYSANVSFYDDEADNLVDAWTELLPLCAPLLASGKLDLLAACNQCQNVELPSSGASPLALEIAKCASQVLNLNHTLPINSNFFDAGFDSLTGTRLLVAVQALDMHCNPQIPYHILLQNPSAEALADALMNSQIPLKHRPLPAIESHLHEADVSYPRELVQSTLKYSQFSEEDQRDTKFIEWLPNASVRLWRKLTHNWECRLCCMSAALSPYFSDYHQNFELPERNRWNVDMGACVDSCPLIFAVRSSDINPDNCAPIIISEHLPGFDIHAVIGSHSGLVVAAEVVSGKIVWRTTLPDRVELASSSPILHPHSSSVLIGCYDGHLYAISILNGTLKWKFNTNSVSWKSEGQRFTAAKKQKTEGISGKESLLNPDNEPVKGGICLIDCSQCMLCSAWTECKSHIGVAGYSKKVFIIKTSDRRTVRTCFSCDIAGSVVAPLLSCRCCFVGGKSRVLAAATSGWLTCFSADDFGHFAKEWSIHLGGPLFAMPVCLTSSKFPCSVVASATGQIHVIAALNGEVLQCVQPIESPCSFMSAPRTVLSSLSGRRLLLLSASGVGGIYVFDCRPRGIAVLARLNGLSSEGRSSFLSAPCIYRLEPLSVKSSFTVLACSSDGKFYNALCDCKNWASFSEERMPEIFDAGCGTFSSPSVAPVPIVIREATTSVHPRTFMTDRPQVSLAVVFGGRDNLLRCLY